jgi:hypothetical protein
MSPQEKIRQVQYEICQRRRQMSFVQLEATVADNPYSLLQIFRREDPSVGGATPYQW